MLLLHGHNLEDLLKSNWKFILYVRLLQRSCFFLQLFARQVFQSSKLFLKELFSNGFIWKREQIYMLKDVFSLARRGPDVG